MRDVDLSDNESGSESDEKPDGCSSQNTKSLWVVTNHVWYEREFGRDIRCFQVVDSMEFNESNGGEAEARIYLERQIDWIRGIKALLDKSDSMKSLSEVTRRVLSLMKTGNLEVVITAKDPYARDEVEW